MKDKAIRFAGIISIFAAIALMILVYALCGTVDLVFVNGEEEYRQENVSVFSDIDVYVGDGEEPINYTFVSGGETIPLKGNEIDFKVKIVTTLVENLFTGKWEEWDQVITLTAE